MKDEVAKVMEALKAEGFEATEDQVKMAVEHLRSGKQEMPAELLDKVAGGKWSWWKTAVSVVCPLAGAALAIDEVVSCPGAPSAEPAKGPASGGSGGSGNNNKQNNSNDHGQQVNVQGDNTGVGGMTMNN